MAQEASNFETIAGLIFLGFIFWTWCKYRGPINLKGLTNTIANKKSPNSGTREYYYAKSLYHTSGIRHINLADCWRECEELRKKYPYEAFAPETIRE